MSDLDYIVDNSFWGEKGVDAETAVAIKFQEAKAYASEAWNMAETYLTDLSNTLKDLATNVDDVDIVFNQVDISELTSNIEGQKPDPVDLSYNIDVFVQPAVPELENVPTVLSDLATLIESKMNTRLEEGSTGLDADVEAAIWARARSRQELENARKYREAENYYSSRGFAMPPGALSGQLNELLIEFARNDSYLNNDIMVEQARLALENENKILELSSKYVLDSIMTRANIIIESNKNKVQNFLAQVEMYKTQIQTELARIETISKVYITQLEAYKTEVQVAAIEIEAKIKPLEFAIKQASIAAEIELKEAELNAENTRQIYGLQVEVVKAGAQVASQLAASAMSSVNASATMGSSASENHTRSSQHSSSSANDTIHQYVVSI